MGLYEEMADGLKGPLAFAWGCFHGDHAHYAAAGSTRETQLKMPLTYGLMWDLIRWTKRQGAAFFDLGGIVPPDAGPDDPRQGIAHFKRLFSTTARTVGTEVCLEPNPLAGIIVRTASFGVRALSRGLKKIGRNPR
jgi:lipid II:glycine glycyltransferase (peptidoglycan interpeptide bridge formation enzyme)